MTEQHKATDEPPAMLPCPFCGAPGQIDFMPERSRQFPHSPGCGKCGAGFGGFESEKKAVAHWNRRTAPQPTQEPTP